ncbi:PA0069 family radical SAM protein [Frigidibacter sp. RF13]|uniref:PA0069 family radical SAM protein n=1 Tax=Frigidibacter sp. RF13 TaxID=2997340 RepID=UPI00226FEFEE|nr:PA0069 family radical SAM protein [Frigidibacter sp. RF13]MCY1127306.1 PA0069 family radical SAM protein [Frigidibacter sp. RF13]
MIRTKSSLPSDPLTTADPALRVRARGAATNDAGRFEPYARAPADDGWDMPEEERLLRTEVSEERPRSMLNFVASPDLPFDRTINPYRGCEHGCSYCFARPTHAFLGLSPGLDFETKLVARPGATAVLAREIGRKGYKVAPIAIGTNTDPYQPIEARYRIMREVLKLLSDWNHPVAIVTKGALIERDIDLLADMARRGLAQVGISVTTLDPGLSRRMEPRAPAPARRLQAIRSLSDAGVPVRVMASPMIPALNDHEMEAILQAGADAGARASSWILLRLPLEVSPLFRDWLARAEPGRAAHVMNLLREMRGGADYDADWGKRMRGEGTYADLLARRFQIAARRCGLDGRLPPLDCGAFRRPLARDGQLALFEGL